MPGLRGADLEADFETPWDNGMSMGLKRTPHFASVATAGAPISSLGGDVQFISGLQSARGTTKAGITSESSCPEVVGTPVQRQLRDGARRPCRGPGTT